MDLPKAIHELEYGQGSVYGPEEEAALGEVLRANAPSCGPQVKKFEETFASYCGVRYGLAVTSGTAGLQLALGIRAGRRGSPRRGAASQRAFLRAAGQEIRRNVRQLLRCAIRAGERFFE